MTGDDRGTALLSCVKRAVPLSSVIKEVDVELEAIVLRQHKIASGRRMIVLFSKARGIISAGTSINEGGKSRSAAALRPFAHGKYEIRKTGDKYHINNSDLISSHYGLGADLDKYMYASMAMEFTGKLLPEDAPAPKLFNMLLEFLTHMEKRTKEFEILLLAYQFKTLKLMGCAPNLKTCVRCGSEEKGGGFSVAEGGRLCPACSDKEEHKEQLIYGSGFDIVSVIDFLTETAFSGLEKLTLNEDALPILREVVKNYSLCHLDIGCLKTEECMKILE